jgi:hypothetical protein
MDAPNDSGESTPNTASTSGRQPALLRTAGVEQVDGDAGLALSLATVGRVTVKPPVFYRSNPQVWFRQMESQFALAGITSGITKFHHIMGAIPEDVAINLPNDLTTYDTLKEQIVSIYQKNKDELLEEALGSITLDGQKPSVCLLRIKRKLQECNLTIDEDVVRHRILQAMPFSTKASLSAHSSLPLDQFAKLADTIYLYSQDRFDRPYNVAAVSADYSNRTAFRRADKPHAPQEIQQSNAFNSQSSTPISHRPFNDRQRPKICRFHLYFAEKANRCKPWCRWPGIKPDIIDSSSRAPSRSVSPAPLSEN